MVSVVIPTFRRPDRIRCSAQSALAQNLEKLEVIVVDDNRDEASRRATEIALNGISDPRLVCLPNQRSPGGCGARNTGIAKARGEFVAFLDDDDELLSGGLEAQLEALAAYPEAALVYGHAEVVDEVYGYSWSYAPRPGLYRVRDLLAGQCPISSSVVMVRKSALIEAGLFDEEMRSFQDLDMWLRIAAAGEIMAHAGKVAKFVQHEGIRTSINIERRIAGLDRIIQKWGPTVEASVPLEDFRARFVSAMHLQNGRLLLAAGARFRLNAIGQMWKAFRTSRSGRVKILAGMGIALFGFRASRLGARTLAGLRAWRDSLA